ncbi:MAG TPA: carboxypeptidase-like regulatory domain-containing protein, partial [Acidobacteriota bacterium]|nr:carboxypeptidase-like regulatory domain-containing protein [Acidobacteriota bacterium]
MVKRLKRSFYLKVCFLCSVVVGSALEPQAFAESVPDRGRFSALLLGSQGEPLSDVLVALVAESLDEARLPMLCKSNSAGRIMLENLQSGTYRLSVRTGRYRAPGERYIEVAPNATTVVTLVLQELLMLGDERVNVGVKPLLRNVDQRRLILRVEPSAGDVAPEDGRPDVGGGVVEVLASTQADDLGLAGLGTAGDGPVTSFGTVLNRSGIGKSLLAGQWGSGDDSFWRLKNVVEWDVGSSRTFHFSLGYGQLSFAPRGVRRTLAAGGKETEAEAEAAPFASGTSRLLSVAFEDNWQLGRVVTLTWGVELDRVDVGESHTFVSPEVGVEYVLSDSTNLFGRLSGV